MASMIRRGKGSTAVERIAQYETAPESSTDPTPLGRKDIRMLAANYDWMILTPEDKESVGSSPAAVAIIVLVDSHHSGRACMLLQRLKRQMVDVPVIAVIADVLPEQDADQPRVLDVQVALFASGADDVTHGSATAAGFQANIALSMLRAEMKQSEELMDWDIHSDDSTRTHSRMRSKDSRKCSFLPSAIGCGAGSSMDDTGSTHSRCPATAGAPARKSFADESIVRGFRVPAEFQRGPAGLSRPVALLGSEGTRPETCRPLSCFNGNWEAVRVNGISLKDCTLNTWLRNIEIDNGCAVLGDGAPTKLVEQSGGVFLCGGKLSLHGDTLVREGKSGVKVSFARRRASGAGVPIMR